MVFELGVGHRLALFPIAGACPRKYDLQWPEVVQELLCGLLVLREGLHAPAGDSLQLVTVLLAAADQEPREREVLQLGADRVHIVLLVGTDALQYALLVLLDEAEDELDEHLEDIEEQDEVRANLKLPDDLLGMGEDGEELDYGDEVDDDLDFEEGEDEIDEAEADLQKQ